MGRQVFALNSSCSFYINVSLVNSLVRPRRSNIQAFRLVVVEYLHADVALWLSYAKQTKSGVRALRSIVDIYSSSTVSSPS